MNHEREVIEFISWYGPRALIALGSVVGISLVVECVGQVINKVKFGRWYENRKLLASQERKNTDRMLASAYGNPGGIWLNKEVEKRAGNAWARGIKNELNQK